MNFTVDWENNRVLWNKEFLGYTNLDRDKKRGVIRFYFGNGDSKKLLNLPIKDFVKVAKTSEIKKPRIIVLHIWTEDEIKIYDISAYIDIGEKNKTRWHLRPKLNTWRTSFTYQEFFEVFIKEIRKKKIDWYFDKPKENEFIFVYRKINSLNSTVISEIEKSLEEIKICIENTLKIVNLRTEENSLTGSFDFPDELKVPCKQYLLYFAQFLKDLGINANTNLKEEAGKVLFSVTPIDNIEALDKIREALAVYLNLPSSPIVYDESFAAMRLQQQIENLQHSQKMAAREMQLTERLVIAQSEMIQEKNIIISQKDSIIEQQNKVIEKITSKSIMIDSLENKEEFEKVFEGLEVGESKFIKEQIGIRFNPVTSLKTLGKKLIGKDDEIISILDSGEETEKNS